MEGFWRWIIISPHSRDRLWSWWNFVIQRSFVMRRWWFAEKTIHMMVALCDWIIHVRIHYLLKPLTADLNNESSSVFNASFDVMLSKITLLIILCCFCLLINRYLVAAYCLDRWYVISCSYQLRESLINIILSYLYDWNTDTRNLKNVLFCSKLNCGTRYLTEFIFSHNIVERFSTIFGIKV